ncbi:MAG: hypothetical protein J6B77_08870 [Clostridia bacterium]|nr:hypothetical protein [Clostridia bacterium]
MQTTPILYKTEKQQSLLKEGQKLLFRKGVQIRLIAAVILLIFVAFPILIFLPYSGGGIVICVAFEALITAPMLYGLFVMVRKAADRLPISVRDLFAAFSRYYVHALLSVFAFLLLALLPLLIPAGIVAGSFFLTELLPQSQASEAYAMLIEFMGVLLAGAALLPAILLQKYSYLMLSIRVKDRSLSLLRALVLASRYLKGQMGNYLKLRMQFLLLDLLSLVSVCALFPLYTIPLYCCVNARMLDLAEEKASAARDLYNETTTLQ